jgi:hypothetical protein
MVVGRLMKPIHFFSVNGDEGFSATIMVPDDFNPDDVNRIPVEEVKKASEGRAPGQDWWYTLVAPDPERQQRALQEIARLDPDYRDDATP